MAVIIFGLLINNDLLIVNTQLFYRIIVVINEKNRLKNASSMSWHQGLLLYRRCNTMCLREVQKIQHWFKFVNVKDSTSLPRECFYVIDGGPLLHSVTWPRPATYEDIFTSYEYYVKSHYGDDVLLYWLATQTSKLYGVVNKKEGQLKILQQAL